MSLVSSVFFFILIVFSAAVAAAFSYKCMCWKFKRVMTRNMERMQDNISSVKSEITTDVEHRLLVLENKIDSLISQKGFDEPLKEGIIEQSLQELKESRKDIDNRISELNEKLADLLFNFNNPDQILEAPVTENADQEELIPELREEEGFFNFGSSNDAWQLDSSRELNEGLNSINGSVGANVNRPLCTEHAEEPARPRKKEGCGLKDDITRKAHALLKRLENLNQKSFLKDAAKIENEFSGADDLINRLDAGKKRSQGAQTPELKNTRRNLVRKKNSSSLKTGKTNLKEKIFNFKEQGLSDEDIARKLKITIGEVQLMQRLLWLTKD
jgi:hypothetical protein